MRNPVFVGVKMDERPVTSGTYPLPLPKVKYCTSSDSNLQPEVSISI